MPAEIEKAKFEQISEQVRSDVTVLIRLVEILSSRVERDEIHTNDNRHWVTDVFNDKFFEVDAKIRRLRDEVLLDDETITGQYFDNATNKALGLLKAINDKADRRELMRELTASMLFIHDNIESDLADIRQGLWHEDWQPLKDTKAVDFVSLERRKYLKANDALAKAKSVIDSAPEDVIAHLRTAIELAFKERYAFKDIRSMKAFLKEADELGLPLPSYSLIYEFYDDGSKRMHHGITQTPFEARQSVRVVSDFITELELMTVPREKITEFVAKAKTVES